MIERQVAAVERDRQRIESAAMARVGAIADTALRHAIHATRIGEDPQRAARRAIAGDAALGLPGMTPTVLNALVWADLQGRRRTQLDAQRAGVLSLNLSAAEDQEKRDKRDLLWLLLLLGLAPDALDTLYATYRPQASRIVQRTADRIVDAIAEGVTPRQPLRGPLLPRQSRMVGRARGTPGTIDLPRDRIRRITDQVARAGLRSESPSRLSTEVEAAVVGGYERGRMAGTPATAEALWGYHYSATLDNRTTEICRALDGTIAPMSDSFWQTFAPPNHFHCRSTVIPVWQSSALRTPTIIQPNATPDQIAQFYAIKQRFLSYQ